MECNNLFEAGVFIGVVSTLIALCLIRLWVKLVEGAESDKKGQPK